MRLVLPITAALMIIVTMLLSKVYDQHAIVGGTMPLNHFTENGDGTITDNWSKKIWLGNLGCIGKKSWPEALLFCKSLAGGMCGLSDESSPGSWRVPEKRELQSLMDPGNFSPVLPIDHSFIGIKDGCYWVIDRGQNESAELGYMYIGDGGVGLGGMNICLNGYHRRSPVSFYLWPVRHTEAVPVN